MDVRDDVVDASVAPDEPDDEYLTKGGGPRWSDQC